MESRKKPLLKTYSGKSIEDLSDQLSTLIAHYNSKDGEMITPISGLSLFRRSKPGPAIFGVYDAGIAVIAQGRKEVSFSGASIQYDKERFLLTSVDIPLSGQVVQATMAKPYLSLFLRLDMVDVRQVLVDSQLSTKESGSHHVAGVVTGPIAPDLMSALVRLVELLGAPEDIPVLGKLLHREIIYRLLKSEQGYRLRQLARVGSNDHGVLRAIEWLKTNFRQPYNLQLLAKNAEMGVSTLHHHFRSITSMSPLQYQKRLRLYEARRLLIAGARDAGTAGFEVGYESHSQFNREYKRLFGLPPARHIQGLKR